MSVHSSQEFHNLLSAKNKEHQIPNHVKEHFSDLSLEVLEHFGFDAPQLLNEYCCALEDALLDQIRLVKDLRCENTALKQNTFESKPKEKKKRFKKKKKK